MRHGSIPGARGRVRPLTLLGDPVLHAPCEEVTDFGPELARLVEDMFATMYAAQGVGLAANQVGSRCGCSCTTARTTRTCGISGMW